MAAPLVGVAVPLAGAVVVPLSVVVVPRAGNDWVSSLGNPKAGRVEAVGSKAGSEVGGRGTAGGPEGTAG